MKSAEVRLENISKQYHRLTAVDNVSLKIEPGSMIALLGPSGCGKTTCLRMIAGLIRPTSGGIFVNNADITHVPVHRRNIGMLFQNYALFPHLTVEENIAFGLEMRGIKKAAAKARVAEALTLVQLSSFGGRYPAQLSGGQQQRVALGRALVIEPAMLLLDEPLGALDKGLRESMQVELRALQQRLGLTTIMVTHDQDEALTMADKIVVMRAGNLEQVGSATEIYQRPVSKFVASFIGVSNMFEGAVERREGAGGLVAAKSGIRLQVDSMPSMASSDVTVSIRPEAITVEKANGLEVADRPNVVAARVEQVIYRGFISHYYLRTHGGQQLIAFEQNQLHTTGLRHTVGDEVVARWDASSNHVIPNP
ncbi:ABC transporter ATP-binding protein [Chelatococcus asaccharovorans]|uniref:ABC transporter ATP-binding protein n=1 Tax=Chelatococcus asaccharovorans TaxID=28210 RepID=UPI00224C7306|nr:ABC transporter ATP-binding protein [Chelatococcus asaccharovorans]CAH1672862.1 putrescine ABC transporter ATP binding subunit [Chelatococcus asaccharovorans]CAH1675747.1 putrescine ABC transporter ATP binding subunit [Chelatococcus asaccharovorans]